MMASRASAVLPVWRSPMINSRCPRPMGIMASTALMPVCMGSLTGWRATTPGARRSMGLNWVVLMGPLPSMGTPRASTTRPSRASPTGTLIMRLVRRTSSPSLISGKSPSSTAPAWSSPTFIHLRQTREQHRPHLVFFQFHGDAGPVVRELDQLARHDLFEAVDSGDAVADGDHRADLGDVDGALVVLDFLAQNTGYFVRSNLSHNSFRLSFRGEAPP